MTPTIGSIVIYTLTPTDAQQVDDRRKHQVSIGGTVPRAGDSLRSTGNTPRAGDTCPAVVVRVFPGADVVNLQVLLDGDDTLWRTSVHEGLSTEQGTWRWPDRVAG